MPEPRDPYVGEKSPVAVTRASGSSTAGFSLAVDPPELGFFQNLGGVPHFVPLIAGSGQVVATLGGAVGTRSFTNSEEPLIVTFGEPIPRD